ncbi:MAG: PH domain-containing protein [Opitutales bacterium]|nr:PH domain-containing protein [Opitutales bacterium]
MEKQKMKSSVYPSKVDIWLAAILILAPLVAVGIGVYVIIIGEKEGWIGIFTGAFIAVVMGALSIPCRYTIKEKEIKIKCGIYEDRIPIEKIIKIFPTMNPLSAPALSLKRIQIETVHSSYLISPKDRESFIEELNKRLPTRQSCGKEIN